MPAINSAFHRKTSPFSTPNTGTKRALDERERLILRISLIFPWVGLLACIAILPFQVLRPGRLELWMLSVGYLLGVIGIEVGYHRLMAHRTFETTRPIKAVLLMLGSSVGVGPLFGWSAVHRRHHEYADQPEDFHSPRMEKKGALQVLRGLWYAHMGWMWNANIEMAEYRRVIDLIQDPVLYRLGRVRMYYLWIALGLILPAVLGGWAWGSWIGAVKGLLWGGIVRILLVQNLGFSINSIGHTFGWKTFKTDDDSRDNPWIALPTFGSGWQNTHHAFPSSWRTHLLWWQVDPAEWVIGALAALGLAWNLRAPSAAQIQAKLMPSDAN